MQAGNYIDFIEPFIRRSDLDTLEPSVEVTHAYRAMMLRLFTLHQQYMNVIDIVDMEGVVESHFEVNLKLEALRDGSYLYIVMYGVSTAEDPFTDVSVNISEHDQEGNAWRSFVYQEHDGGVYRKDNEDKESLSSYHFSYIDYVETYAELLKHRDSEWDAVKKEANDAYLQLINLTENVKLEASVGLNDLPVDEHEINQLRDILFQAQPIAVE